MFINFSNHPYALWSAEQQAAAQAVLRVRQTVKGE